MSNYREQYIVKQENVNKNIFKYYVGKVTTYGGNDNSFYCPICQHLSKKKYSWEDNKNIIKCFPHKRVVISGFLFWKKRCPIEGLHTHYICETCKFHTIHHNEVANSLIFAETPLKD
jgi:hypothetical protein